MTDNYLHVCLTGTQHDDDVDSLVAEMYSGAERCGSGGSAMARDLEYKMESRMDQTQIQTFKSALVDKIGYKPLIEISYDEWTVGDDLGDPVTDLIAE